MKKLIVTASLLAALLLSQTASADNRHNRRGYDNYRYDNYRFGNFYSNRYDRNYRRSYDRYNYRRYDNRRVNPYHYGRRDRRGSSYINFSYGNYYPRYRRNRSFDAGDFVGGLVLGSLISSASSPRYETVRYRSRPVTRTREVVYVKEPASRPAAIASGRSLLRDLEGNCFERNIDEQGNEVRVQLENSECAF